MAKEPLFVEENQLVEVVLRTAGGRFLLRPSAVLNALILGVLARALFLFAVHLHAFVFLSNHAHLLLTVPDADALSRFLCHLKGNLARRVLRLLGVEVRVWGSRSRPIPVLDDEAAVDRLRYILSHGVKEGLVASPLDWPGATCARALVGDEVLSGTWIDGVAAYEDARRHAPRGPASYTTTLPIELVPLPCWSHLSPDEYRSRCRELIHEIERDGALAHGHPMGVAEVLAVDPLDKPANPHLRRAPRCHATSPDARASHLERRRRFVMVYRAAAEALKLGLPAVFPAGCHLPRGPFSRFTAETPPPRGGMSAQLVGPGGRVRTSSRRAATLGSASILQAPYQNRSLPEHLSVDARAARSSDIASSSRKT